MRKDVNTTNINKKTDKVEPAVIFFHKENLTPAGVVIQEAIKERLTNK